MPRILLVLSCVALAAIGWGTFAFMRLDITEAANKQIMLWASVAWFVFTPFWMQRKSGDTETPHDERTDSR